jgi:hypothetical protein
MKGIFRTGLFPTLGLKLKFGRNLKIHDLDQQNNPGPVKLAKTNYRNLR